MAKVADRAISLAHHTQGTRTFLPDTGASRTIKEFEGIAQDIIKPQMGAVIQLEERQRETERQGTEREINRKIDKIYQDAQLNYQDIDAPQAQQYVETEMQALQQEYSDHYSDNPTTQSELDQFMIRQGTRLSSATSSYITRQSVQAEMNTMKEDVRAGNQAARGTEIGDTQAAQDIVQGTLDRFKKRNPAASPERIARIGDALMNDVLVEQYTAWADANPTAANNQWLLDKESLRNRLPKEAFAKLNRLYKGVGEYAAVDNAQLQLYQKFGTDYAKAQGFLADPKNWNKVGIENGQQAEVLITRFRARENQNYARYTRAQTEMDRMATESVFDTVFGSSVGVPDVEAGLTQLEKLVATNKVSSSAAIAMRANLMRFENEHSQTAVNKLMSDIDAGIVVNNDQIYYRAMAGGLGRDVSRFISYLTAVNKARDAGGLNYYNQAKAYYRQMAKEFSDDTWDKVDPLKETEFLTDLMTRAREIDKHTNAYSPMLSQLMTEMMKSGYYKDGTFIEDPEAGSTILGFGGKGTPETRGRRWMVGSNLRAQGIEARRFMEPAGDFELINPKTNVQRVQSQESANTKYNEGYSFKMLIDLVGDVNAIDAIPGNTIQEKAEAIAREYLVAPVQSDIDDIERGILAVQRGEVN